MQINAEKAEFIHAHSIARLATVSAKGRPSTVPVCFAFDGAVFYSALDEKPKSVAIGELRRVRNIRENPNVSLVIDDYFDDWTRLAYAQISGTAELLEPDGDFTGEHLRAVELLRHKYPQYRSMAIDKTPIIRITPQRVRFWRYAGAGSHS